MNKLVEVMKFQLSYFKSWKMMLWKCYTQYVSKFGKFSSGHRTGKGHFSFQSLRKAIPKNAQSESEVFQSCLNLCDSMDCSLPGSSIHGILQARVLEWVAISFSKGSSQPRDRTQVSRIGGRHFNLWTSCNAGDLGSIPESGRSNAQRMLKLPHNCTHLTR